jgi:rhamnulokinase
LTTLAAVDLGAQSGRVGVGRFDGERLGVEEVHRFPNVPVKTDARLRWDALRLYADVLEGLRAAAATGPIDSVAVDSWAVDFGLVDRNGELLGNPVHYRDARRAAAFEPTLERVSAAELYERTGIQPLPINTIFELAAMAADGDPTLAADSRMLMIPDLIHHRLCGSSVSEHTNATTTACRDLRDGAWLLDVLERLDVPSGPLPEVVPPATILGTAVTEIGIGAPVVVAGATHDTASAVAGTPLRAAGSVFVSLGTWSLVGVEAAEPMVSDEAFAANLTNEGGVAGTVRILRNITGLWLLDECVRAWSATRRRHSIDDLIGLAESSAPLRSFVDPNEPSFTGPGDMPSRIAEYCERTGQPRPEDHGAIARCIFESLALKHAETVDALSAVTGRELDTVHVVGGGAKNELLCRWTANASGRVVEAGPAEATLVGNLVVQAMALGEISSLAEGRDVVRRSFTPDVFEPEVTCDWLEARERFATLTAPSHPMGVGSR